MKRIAVIAHGLSGGGAERVASIVSNHFAKQGHKVLFIAAYSKEREYELYSDIEYTFIGLSSKAGLLRFFERSLKIKKIVEDFKADVAFSFVTPDLIALSFSKIPLIPSLRIDPKYLESKPLKWHMRQLIYSRAKNIIFQTQDARDYFNEKIRSKGVVIGNPIKDDLPVWDEMEHKKTFMTACRISKQKNIPMLINAFVRFHEKFPEYKLEIYGDGEPKEYKTEMEKLVHDKNADGYISFMGHSKQIHNVMKNSEAFVLTSDFEGLSNSMLEAMAIGMPCICTDCPPGGASEYIENNVSGILIPVGGEDELVAAMCSVADSAELRHTLSGNSQYVRNALDKDEICRRWEELI